MPSTRRLVSGSQIPHYSRAQPIASLDPKQRLHVTMVLHPRDTGAHELHGVHAPPKRGRTTGIALDSASDLARRYDPGDDRFEAIRRFASRYALTVVETSRARHDVVLEGTIADLGRAFGVNLHHASVRGRVVRAHAESIRLPHDLASIVDGVLGLDTVPLHVPFVRPGPPERRLSPRELTRHYAFPPGNARGQRIALLQFGGGYADADISVFSERFGIALPAINDRAVAGNDGAVRRNAPPARATMRRLARAWASDASFAQLMAKHGSDLSPFINALEVTMDLELALAMGGGAAIDVLFAPPGADGWRRALYAALGTPYAGAHGAEVMPVPSVLSISWGDSERNFGAMKLRLIDHALVAASRLGVAICASTGDRGSTNTLTGCDGVNVNFPASSPVVLAVGGTRLSPSGRHAFGETAWKGALKGSPVASGGGMSGFFARPSYQRALATPGAPESWRDTSLPEDFVGRWLPDVAASAAFECGVEIVAGGTSLVAGGTSAATPVVAALLARIGARVGRSLPAFHAWLYSRAARGACADIVDGDNDVCAGTLPFYHAGKGWDPCTGHGTLIGTAVVDKLLDVGVKARSRTTSSAP